jgi:plasmid stability protein
MAQIVVRGIDDEVMRQFKERAKQQGKSAEQAVRDLIADAVRDNQRTTGALARLDEIRERLYQKYGELPQTAAEMIREDRDSR